MKSVRRAASPGARTVRRSRPARLGALLAAAVTATGAASGAATAGFPSLGPDTSLLVVSPHPDDETLCCAGVIQRVVQAHGRASIVWVTSGDASRLDLLLIEKSPFMSPAKARELGARRMREARAAAAVLGVPAGEQLFLGYPDRGIRELLGAHERTPYRSPFTAVEAVPYRDALFPGHAYTGASLEQDFAAVLARVRPTLLLAPCPQDSHPDHRAAGLLAMRAVAAVAAPPAVRCWIVHGGEGWPAPRGLHPGLPLTPPPRAPQAAWSGFALTPAEEDRKLAALREYATQLPVLEPFLLAFVRTTELFSANW